MNLYALIPIGPAHAIPKRDLASIIGVDERVLRNMVHHERRAGRIILTDCASGGYFRPDNTNQTIHSKVKKIFADNEDTVASQLIAGCDPEQNLDPISAKLLVRGMMLSAQIAVQITLRILEDVGVIETQSDAVAFAQLINDEISKSDNENVNE